MKVASFGLLTTFGLLMLWAALIMQRFRRRRPAQVTPGRTNGETRATGGGTP